VSVDLAYVRLRAPEFAPVSDAAVQAAIDDTELIIVPGQTSFSNGSIEDLAIFYVTAHRLSMTYPQYVNRTVTEERVGPLSKAYGAKPSNPTEAGYGSSSYGRLFLSLCRSAVGPTVSVL